MKILKQCIYFPPEVGGLESHVYYLSLEFVRQGHEVKFLTSRSLPGTPRKENMGGIDVRRYWFPNRGPIGWAIHSIVTTPFSLLSARKAEVLHAQTFASAIPLIAAKFLMKKPLVLTLHTSHFLRLARKRRWRPVMKWLIKHSDYLLAASEEILNVALDLYPHPRSEALVNGVDTHMFSPPEEKRKRNRPLLIAARRHVPKNGVEYLLRAMPKILEEREVDLWLVGSGPERENLESLARDLGIKQRVRFLGTRANDLMPTIFGHADLAILPSLMEATSIAALEAMSCELPVAASDVGGLPEIVDDSVGGLFEPYDPDDLARVVLGLLSDPEALQEKGRLARKRVRTNWSVERLARRHLEIYNTLLEEKKAKTNG